jgi:RNA polymerase primary sigma factor
MQRSIAKTDAMRVPMGAAVTDAAVRSARDDLEAEFGRKPTVAEIAELTGLAERKVEESLGRRPIVSLESPIGEDGGVMGDLIADGEAIDPHTITEQTVLTESLEAAIAALSPLHRTVLIMRFGLEDGRPRPVSEIAAEAGIAESEVRVVADEAVRSISEAIGHLEDLVAA